MIDRCCSLLVALLTASRQNTQYDQYQSIFIFILALWIIQTFQKPFLAHSNNMNVWCNSKTRNVLLSWQSKQIYWDDQVSAKLLTRILCVMRFCKYQLTHHRSIRGIHPTVEQQNPQLNYLRKAAQTYLALIQRHVSLLKLQTVTLRGAPTNTHSLRSSRS